MKNKLDYFKVLETDFSVIAIVDNYESLIWTDRYRECGDFEIYVGVTPYFIDLFKQERYIEITESDHLMIIESVEIKSDSINGNHMIITGRSLESILDRRIVWQQTNLDGDFQNGVEYILNSNIISPAIADRRIDNFVFVRNTDENIERLTLQAQYTGDNIYDIIKNLCTQVDVGYGIVLNEAHQFVMSFYRGVDRSYDQFNRPYVVFSPKFENIINTDYSESYKTYKNVTLVAGEGEGYERKTFVVGNETGLTRRENFTDARDISTKAGSGDDEYIIPIEEYNQLLKQRGEEDLAEKVIDKKFEGKVEASKMFVYGKDFFLGDIIQIVNEYGIEGKARIIEIIHSSSNKGVEIYPTFEAIQEKNGGN